MRCLKLVVLMAGLWTGFSGVAKAQTAVYGEFSGSKLDKNSAWLFGPTIGLYHDNGYGLIGAGFDVRGSFLSRSGTSLDSVLVGGRVSLHPKVLPLKPYAEALGGLGHYTAPNSSASNNFQYQFLAGIDSTLLPYLDWRVVEFSYGGLSVLNGTYNPKTISTGIVFRLP